MSDKGPTYLCLAHMGGNEERFIHDAIESNWVTSLGPYVDKFERSIEKWLIPQEISEGVGSPVYVAALSTGTSALHLALRLLGVGAGDDVICQSWTFAASVNPVLYRNATPVLVDSEDSTWNISPRLLEEAIVDRIALTGKTPKAIVAVDLYGMPARWDEILEIAGKYEIPVVEDSAEAMGSLYKGRKCGTFGNFGVYSFNGNKMITTGAGGALICHSEEDKERTLFLATQARERALHYEHVELGYNYRMSNISAAIGCGQMEVLDEHIAHHIELHDIYAEELGSCDGVTVTGNPGADFRSNFWLTTVLFDAEQATIKCVSDDLRSAGVETRPLWKPMHLQPLYKGCPAYTDGTSENLWDKGLCLPSGPWVTKEKASMIARRIKSMLSKTSLRCGAETIE